jgi:predicted TIM-barrel fold metal-dependent hydrolase
VKDAERIARDLHRELAARWVVDAHEHLADEAERLSAVVDAASAFCWYPKWPAQAALMSPAEYAVWQDPGQPLERRWAAFAKYLPFIRDTTFVRSVLIGIRQLYGYEDVTDANYLEVSRAMRDANRPGIYRAAFRDRARIAAALNQSLSGRLPPKGCFRVPQMWFDDASLAAGRGRLSGMEAALGRDLPALAAWTEALPAFLELQRRQGVVGIKMGHRPIPCTDPAAAEVAPVYAKLRADGDAAAPGDPVALADRAALRDYEAHTVLRAAAGAGLPVIYHAGYEGVWEDFRQADPRTLVPVFQRYRDVRFELYHAGTVWDRELGMIALAFPNVWLDQCWAHGLSREMARSALDGWLDMVPANKIIAWGGDAHTQVEAVLGDLEQVRRSIAQVLARRIRERALTESRALDVAAMLLYDNPKRLYGLSWDEPGSLSYA